MGFGKPGSHTPDSEIDALRAYAEAVPATASPAEETGAALPDVDTMIERLKGRLEKDPQNRDGWRMLGWSYFNTKCYTEAVKAYARAIELDPASTEIKLAYEEAKKQVGINVLAPIMRPLPPPPQRIATAFPPRPPWQQSPMIEAMPTPQCLLNRRI
jgi:tetratricopeptide (TPR) repeat protein